MKEGDTEMDCPECGMTMGADHARMHPDHPNGEDKMPMGKTFFITKDADGHDRWLSFSSNAFEDREVEIVSTKALIGAVEEADKTGDRGDLRLFHLTGTSIGDCDFQGVEGRFLVESGTFHDTPMAQAAVEYFKTTDDPLGVSIGFLYPESELRGGVYGRIGIKERSVCPLDSAANPWTAFGLAAKGGDVMDKRKSDFLTKIYGADRASLILNAAASATKELEQTVRHKTAPEGTQDDGGDTAEAVGAARAAIEALPDGEAKKTLLANFEAQYPAEKDDGDGDEGEGTDEADFIETMKTLFEPLVSAQTAILNRLDALEAGAKTKAEEPKQSPRAARIFGNGHRATEGDSQLADTDKVADLLKGQKAGDTDDEPINPVLPYVQQLFAGVGAEN